MPPRACPGARRSNNGKPHAASAIQKMLGKKQMPRNRPQTRAGKSGRSAAIPAADTTENEIQGHG